MHFKGGGGAGSEHCIYLFARSCRHLLVMNILQRCSCRLRRQPLSLNHQFGLSYQSITSRPGLAGSS